MKGFQKILPIAVIGISFIPVIKRIRQIPNDILIDGLNRENFWDGEEDPRYEYDIQGVVIGKDGKPKRKK